MKLFTLTVLSFMISMGLYAQSTQIRYTEYDLDNGMHVILHQDRSTPIVAVSILYHVGSKNEETNRTGFAHFFEHLMFEGSQNIGRGEYSEYVEKNGGTLNANTSQDRTYYYEILPSNQLELGLWLESERLLHAKVDETGIETQREVVKEEKRQRIDNQPYMTFMTESFARMFKEHPYRWAVIGSMEDLNAAEERDYVNFYKTFYVPANATLSIAGDIDIEEAKRLINKYFGSIPKGQAINLYRDFINLSDTEFSEKYGKEKSIFNQEDFFRTTSAEGKAMIAAHKKIPTEVPRPSIVEGPLAGEIIDTIYDNIQLPAVFVSYRSPKSNSKDAYALAMLNQVLSGSSSSRLNKEVVEKKELAAQLFSFTFPLEDPGMTLVAGIVAKDIDSKDMLDAMDIEIEKVQNELISEEEFQKVKNQFENNFYYGISSIAGIAENLANSHVYYNNTNLINEEMGIYESITREDLRDVAIKYLPKDKRVVLYYLPKDAE